MVWRSCAPLLIFYGKEQTLSFEGNAGVSKPDVDPDQAEPEWKIFRRILFTQHRSESGLQKIVTTFLASSALVAGFRNLASLASGLTCDNSNS